MSAVAGVYQRDHRAISRADVCALLDRLRDRGPDHQAVALLGPAGLGHALLQTVPEDRPGAQPAVDRAAGLAVALDGRLDNRDDLAAVAGLAGAPPECSDAALILAAFAAAGTRVFERILGDFAAIVWDGPGRRLIAARDVFGIRPLAYREAGGCVLVASEVRALVPAGPVTPDEGRVAEMLAGAPTSVDDSLYREIRRLRPGHLLVATSGGIRIERFAALDGTARLPPRPAAAYREEFCALMDTAVRARLRASTGVGMMLSGGLDSTSVYGTVRTVAPALEVPAFTVAHREPSDESPVARHTVAHHRGRSVLVPEGFASFDAIAAAARLLEVPVYPGGTNSVALRRRAVEEGCRVLLSGNGGDEWYTGSNWAGADLLWRLRLGALARLWRARLTAVDPPPLRDLVQSALVPLVPAPLRFLWRRLRRGAAAPPWLRPAFVASVSLQDRLRVRPEINASSVARRAMLTEGLHGLNVYAFEDNDRLSALCGTEERVPYYDRRVVEFALALPDDLLAAQPTQKQFVRDAMADRLPPLFHAMRPCLDYEFINRESLERLGGRRLFDALEVAEAGLVDGAIARAAADACYAGRPYGGRPAAELSWPLWSLAAVEVWWRAAISGSLRTDRDAPCLA